MFAKLLMNDDPFHVSPEKTVMAFDFGSKKTGVAIGNAGAVMPLQILPTDGRLPDVKELDRLIQEWKPGGFLVGLPVQGGSQLDSIRKKILAFCHWLEKHYHLPVETVDESYTSVSVHRTNADRIDTLSATLIIEQWYHQQ